MKGYNLEKALADLNDAGIVFELSNNTGDGSYRISFFVPPTPENFPRIYSSDRDDGPFKTPLEAINSAITKIPLDHLRQFTLKIGG